MDNFLIDNPTISITNATIDAIEFAAPDAYLTISFTECIECNETTQVFKLLVNKNTFIVNENGMQIQASDLSPDMIIDALVSASMTRSNPPQTTAFVIRVVNSINSNRPPMPSSVTNGIIIDMDRQNRNFTTISGTNPSSIVRFNAPDNVIVIDRNGRPGNFSTLMTGQRVQVRHANFMTSSIPPQTTAFEVRVM